MLFAIPVLLAAVAVLAGCKRDKSSQEETPAASPPLTDRPTDPEAEVPFVKMGEGRYWHDLNLNGKIADNETVFISPEKDLKTEIENFLKLNRARFSPCVRLLPSFPANISFNSLDHPEKLRLHQQLQQDMAALKAMKERPEIYTKLLGDLELISEELPSVAFRYPEVGEVPDGFIGTYNPLVREMVVNEGAPASLLVHEMDHHLTAVSRVSEWTLPRREKCGPFDVRSVPAVHGLPPPSPERTQFRFSLDYPGSGQNEFTYDDVEAWKPVFRTLELGAEVCFPQASKDTAFANEVRGYLTMSRYLLFRSGVTEKEIAALRGENEAERGAAEKRLLSALESHLRGSNLNPRWAHGLVLHYLARGGSGRADLGAFVKDYYVRMQAPGFVDVPGCQD